MGVYSNPGKGYPRGAVSNTPIIGSTSATVSVTTSSTQYTSGWMVSNEPEPADKDTLWTDEPIIGFRGWIYEAGLLRGGYAPWKTTTVRATHQGDSGVHKSPDWNCLCGINCFKQPDGPGTFYPILGMVELKGLVIEYEGGYRGEIGTILHVAIWKGYPEMIEHNKDEFVEKLEFTYPGALITLERKIPWRK